MEAVQVQPEVDSDHFVGHVVASRRTVRASEDIRAANGMKLLAKGGRVDAETRERLVAHKLAKPLEQCLEASDAIDGAALVEVARQLFDEQPALQALHGAQHARALSSLGQLSLSPPLRSLLTLYTELPKRQLDHAVVTALIATGLAAKLGSEVDCPLQTLLVGGLFHDIGELYIDPELLTGARLEPSQWRHIVAHPVIGHRVLIGLDGAGRAVAEGVLQHHERRDGFGYPRRLSGKELTSCGELLAAAEWLAGLMRSGRSPTNAATAATRLMPGGFRRSIASAIWSAMAGDAPEGTGDLAAQHDAIGRFVRIADTLRRFREARPWLDQVIAAGTAASAVLAANHVRMEQIERSFVSCGLSGEDPLALLERLGTSSDPGVFEELRAIVRELGWRLRELERDTLLRADALPDNHQRVVHEFVLRLKDPGRD